MSLGNALVSYNLTEEVFHESDPPIETRSRTYCGNNFQVVKIDDIAALYARVQERKEIAKYGSKDLWEQHKKDERERQHQELREKQEREEHERNEKRMAVELLAKKEAFAGKFLKIFEISKGLDVPNSIDGLKNSKTKAKKDWFLRDRDIAGLKGVKEGCSIQYAVRDLIQAAEKRHYSPSFAILEDKLQDRPKQLPIYARYLHDKLQQELNGQAASFTTVVRLFAEIKLTSKVSQTKGEIEKLEEELKELKNTFTHNQNEVDAFKRVFPAVKKRNTAMPSDEKENTAPRPQKKQKA